MAKQASQKMWVYLLTLEHYHFPTNEDTWSGDMVAATPQLVVAGTPELADYLRIQAHRKACEQATKYYVRDGAEVHDTNFPYHTKIVKEGRTNSPDEYRVWVESENPNQDRFVWVVRKVEFTK